MIVDGCLRIGIGNPDNGIANLKKIGIVNYTLEVRVSNAPAIRLYESLGFESAGIRPGFYDKPKEDAMIMWKRQP